MKKLTLSKAWSECLRMWKWVAENHEEDEHVLDAKRTWLLQHGYKIYSLENDCFFCEYQKQNAGSCFDGKNESCTKCPARIVNRKFCCERNISYAWHEKPKAFYRKIVQLDKKRRMK